MFRLESSNVETGALESLPVDGADGGDTDANGHLQSIAMPTGVPHAERTTSGQPAWEWRRHQFLNL